MFLTIKKIVSALLAFVMAMCSGFALPEEQKCKAEFNGTFLQSWLSSTWSDDQWESEMQYMKDCGIEYLIIQDSANKDLRKNGGSWTVYYDSKLSEFEDANKSQQDVISSALYHCKKAGIKVFVPLAMFDDFWYEGSLTSQYYEICSLSAKMAEEIYSNYYKGYEDTFCGWYFTPELNNVITCALNVAGTAKGLNTVLDKLTEIDPSLPLLLSPFYANYTSTGPAVTLTQLVRLFSLVNFRDGDIFCPQDGVGAGWIDEDDLAKVWSIYSQAVETADADIKLWANCENFTLAFADTVLDGVLTRPATENTVAVPSTLDRLVRQMDIASRYAENIISFSFNHYYSPKMSSSMFMETYKDYLANGCVLESQVPTAPDSFEKAENDGSVVLTWDEAEDNFGVAYYRIEKDGKFLTRFETYANYGALSYTDANGSVNSTYTITAFDAAGNCSQTVTAK